MKKPDKGIVRSFFILVLLVATASTGFAQNTRELIRQADVQMKEGRVALAIVNYLEADRQVPDNALLALKLGKAYLESSFKYKALPYLQKAYQEIPTADPDIVLFIALAYQYNYQFQDAIHYYQVYAREQPDKEALVKKKIESCHTAAELYSSPKEVKIASLGSVVNSPEKDFSPLITLDENMLVFTSSRKGSTGGKKTHTDEFFEDIYITYRLSDTLWTPPRSISRSVNTPYHDAAAALSPDGKKLFVYSDEGGGDLLLSEFDGVDWSKPVSLGVNVNSPYWETSVTITADGQKIYFSSNRPGGFGKLDIYMSTRQPNGQWGPAQNLGPTINTAENEDSPFVHPDGLTLYFSSNGHPGLGGYDIFKSEFVNGQWAKAENFGYPVNTTDNDAHFVMSGNRKKAYFTSVKEEGVGKADLYAITFPYNTSRPPMPKEEIPAPKDTMKGKSTLLSGNVTDHAKNAPLRATVSLTNNETAELVAEDETDPVTGNFELMVYGIGNFGLNIESDGFLFYSRNLKITEADQEKGKKEVKMDVQMRPLSVGSRVVLSNIFFNTGEYTLRKESYAELDKVLAYLRKSPKLKVQINGHTDNVGDAASNKKLSERRAESVREYLIKGGVHKDHLSVKGYGEERPLVSNDDEFEGRELNRRTEIEVTAF